jgi:hypothetical protein
MTKMHLINAFSKIAQYIDVPEEFCVDSDIYFDDNSATAQYSIVNNDSGELCKKNILTIYLNTKCNERIVVDMEFTNYHNDKCTLFDNIVNIVNAIK